VAELALPSRAAPFSAAAWLYELKYDGFRLLASKDGTRVALRYRSGRVATGLFPEIAEAVAALPAEHVLLDGELVVFGEDGRSDFNLLCRRAFAKPRDKRANPVATDCVFDMTCPPDLSGSFREPVVL
jgi:bifunctional non-homologous end joining protein LigD